MLYPYEFDENIINLDLQIDSEKKDVGDIILIIDYSAVSDESGVEISDNLINRFDEFIVIESNKNFKFKSIITYVQDLVVINRRTQIKYRTPSYYTQLVKR